MAKNCESGGRRYGWAGLWAAVVVVTAGCSLDGRRQILPAEASGRVVRVACVGDSITFGTGIEDRGNNSYPALLGRMLGAGYEVKNLGVSGATMQRGGDVPYWDQAEFRELGVFGPDAIVLMLGTNDTKPENWKGAERFRGDLEMLLDHFGSLPSRPKVWVCLPVPVYGTRWGIDEGVLAGEIIPVIRGVARERNLPVVDLHRALSHCPDYFPDTIHPNEKGASVVAMSVHVALLGRY